MSVLLVHPPSHSPFISSPCKHDVHLGCHLVLYNLAQETIHNQMHSLVFFTVIISWHLFVYIFSICDVALGNALHAATFYIVLKNKGFPKLKYVCLLHVSFTAFENLLISQKWKWRKPHLKIPFDYDSDSEAVWSYWQPVPDYRLNWSDLG